jgi:hypothetical protein
MIRKTLIVLALAVVVAAVPQAEAVSYLTGANTSTIPGLTGATTTGAMMDGLQITAIFAGGSMETLFWADTGADSGGVTGTGWSLSLDGDTFFVPWIFDFTGAPALTTLQLSGLNALTVFDRRFGAADGTPGSFGGWDWQCLAGPCGSAVVTFDYQVRIGAAAAVGDLWQTISVSFGSGISSDFRFRQDTDNDARFDDPVIPEPGTLALLGAGLAGLRFLRGRRES